MTWKAERNALGSIITERNKAELIPEMNGLGNTITERDKAELIPEMNGAERYLIVSNRSCVTIFI
jgi:hypothetical protein